MEYLKWYEETAVVRTLFFFTFFVVAGILDLKRAPENPKRLREYLFLAYGAVLASAYGIVHDQISCTVSPDYFVFYKGIPVSAYFRIEVSLVALKSTWWVGVVGAAAVLVANNESGGRPQLGYATLRSYAWMILVFAAIGSAIGFLSVPRLISPIKFPGPVLPERSAAMAFLSTWGMHLGSYLGGLVGILSAGLRVHRTRLSGRHA